MLCLDTKKEVPLDWFLNALENDEIIIDSRNMTKEDREDMRREIAEYKAKRQKNRVKEAVFV